MSMSPNNPFEDPQDDAARTQGPPPARSRSKGCLIGCAVAGVLGLFVCCGGGIAMMQFGVSVLATQYQSQLEGNPVIVEQIGEIESVKPSWSATLQEAQKAEQQGGETAFAFEIKGSKGTGTLLVKQEPGGDPANIGSATLVMPDGTRHPINTAAGPPAIEDLDRQLEDMIDSGEVDSGPSATESQGVEVQQD